MSLENGLNLNTSASSGGAEASEAFARLREAYIDLEATKPLRELGQTTAFINHEIKNYMMVISGYASLLLRSKTLSEKDRGMVDNIASTAAKLQEFNLSVLEMSASKSGIRAEEFDLVDALQSCAEARFPAQMDKFSVSGPAPGSAVLINGNREKLERAFSCAFSNSLEAGAQAINVRISVFNYIAVIVIEDDGAGCDAADVPNLSKTFFSTKRGEGGIGLGLCAMRSIIESHGGNVGLYSKNLLGGGRSGLRTVVTLPASKRTPSVASKSEVLVVKEGFNDPSGILSMLKNIKTIPRIAAEPNNAGLAQRSESLSLTAFAAAPQAAELKAAAAGNPAIKILAIQEAEGGTMLVLNDDGTRKDLLTEEFIVGCLAG
jgi:hypothetical protein